MTSKRFFTTMVALLALTAGPAAARAEGEAAGAAKLPMREFAGFLTDAETVRGFYGEIGSVYSAEDDTTPDIQQFDTNFRLAYGGEQWEAGAELPYVNMKAKGVGSPSGVGDMRLWGKYLPLRTERYTLGGGLVTTMPTGENAFTTDEYGFEPFLTGAAQVGSVSVRSHLGYSTYTSIENDGIDYSVAALLPVNEYASFRAELAGLHGLDVKSSNDDDIVMVMPGFDFSILDNGWALLMRVVGGAGITDESPNYMVGLSFAVEQAGN